MKKFINSAEALIPELLEGFTLAYPGFVSLGAEGTVTRTTAKARGKVGLVTLGGGGHEPGLSGFVGEGMLDVSVVGGIFSAPGAPRVLSGIKLGDFGAGVLLVVLNHAGDVLSSDMALELAAKAKLDVRRVLTHDDISTGPKERPKEGRGLVGFLAVYKVAGAAAEAGKSLDEVFTIAERMQRNTRTLAVATREATHPATGKMIGQTDHALGEDEMEIGMGQHGEAGSGRTRMLAADETAELMISRLVDHLDVESGEELLVVMSGSGATTHMEMFIVFRRIYQVLKARGIMVVRSLIGEYITTQEQGGFQLMIARMDPELVALWDAPCATPYLVTR